MKTKTCTIEIMHVYGTMNSYTGVVSYRGKVLYETSYNDTPSNLLYECKEFANDYGFSDFKGFVTQYNSKKVIIKGKFVLEHVYPFSVVDSGGVVHSVDMTYKDAELCMYDLQRNDVFKDKYYFVQRNYN